MTTPKPEAATAHEIAAGPRRRIVLRLDAGADSWDDLKGLFRYLETEIAVDRSLSACTVSGGYSSGFILTINEDESITHESWAAANEAYCAALREQSK